MKILHSTMMFMGGVLGAITLMSVSAYGENKGREILVNEVPLGERTIQALEQTYHVRLVKGAFWYDRVSGLWGMQGGPTMGQILPGLNLGGPLRADASNGRTRVFINGREIHRLELRYLQQLFGQVRAARYWLNSRGIGEYEGGPAEFNLNIAGQGIGGDWIERTPGGTIGGDANCTYYNHPNGTSVMNCN